jgi:hypothetical protein
MAVGCVGAAAAAVLSFEAAVVGSCWAVSVYGRSAEVDLLIDQGRWPLIAAASPAAAGWRGSRPLQRCC